MKLTEKQKTAQRMLASDSIHFMLFGGSRSGKTFLHIRNIVMRALKAPGSRHCVLRFRFNHVKTSIIHDTFPKVMELCFSGITYHVDKTDWFAQFPNGAQIWFGGLDDKARSEKILGQEHATIYLNECSQIPYSSVEIAMTRLAQTVNQVIDGRPEKQLPLRMYYDCNPPNKLHWSYRLFVQKIDPVTKKKLRSPSNYQAMQINPGDNLSNLPANYLSTLEDLSSKNRKRFLYGEFADANPNALFDDNDIEKWRVIDGKVPDMVRVVVAVDPSGSGDEDNASNDAIGIAVVGLGVDGNGYLLEDCTIKAGPATWGKVATLAYDRHMADVIVGEANYGGAMVEFVVQTARPRTPYKSVNATRGKVVRAEPISALYEHGKVRHVGYFTELEEELCGFSTVGYTGEKSPNRADAVIWALTEIFEGMVAEVEDDEEDWHEQNKQGHNATTGY
jgi:phage terminase large subunit-like protein